MGNIGRVLLNESTGQDQIKGFVSRRMKSLLVVVDTEEACLDRGYRSAIFLFKISFQDERPITLQEKRGKLFTAIIYSVSDSRAFCCLARPFAKTHTKEKAMSFVNFIG
jgi:hypothetical protein